MERLVNRVVLTLLSVGLGAGSVLLLGVSTGPSLIGTEVTFTEVAGWTGLTFSLVLLLRVLLEVVRSENLKT